MTVTVTVNGKKEQIAERTSVLQYISGKNIDPKTVVVELNMDIIKREQQEQIFLQDDDNLEILRFVGGG